MCITGQDIGAVISAFPESLAIFSWPYPGDPGGDYNLPMVSGTHPAVHPAAELAVIVPIHNEEPVLVELHRRLRIALDRLGKDRNLSGEIIAVDDGSTDGSLPLLRHLAGSDSALRILHLEPNRGQHEAVLAGLKAAGSPLIVTIDADLQNPPEEIPRIVDLLASGFDLVATRRVRREDPLSRKIASRIANLTSAALTRRYTKVPLHDMGCMLRGFRRELVESMLRTAGAPEAPAPFIPALAIRHARRICEIDVEHAPRGHGRSRYGWLRLFGLQARLLATLARPQGR